MSINLFEKVNQSTVNISLKDEWIFFYVNIYEVCDIGEPLYLSRVILLDTNNVWSHYKNHGLLFPNVYVAFPCTDIEYCPHTSNGSWPVSLECRLLDVLLQVTMHTALSSCMHSDTWYTRGHYN